MLLLVEGHLVFDQEVRHLPVRDLAAHTPQQLGHLRLAHLCPKVEPQRQALEPRTTLAAVAWRQGRQGGLMLRRRVPFLFMKQDIVGAEEHVLHHHVLVPLEHGIRRQVGRINLHHLFPVDDHTVRFAVFRPGLWLTPFLC